MKNTMTQKQFIKALEKKNYNAMVKGGMITECPICGKMEADCNNSVGEVFNIPVGVHCGQVDRRCGTSGTYYMPEDSPYNAECYTHNNE